MVKHSIVGEGRLPAAGRLLLIADAAYVYLRVNRNAGRLKYLKC